MCYRKIIVTILVLGVDLTHSSLVFRGLRAIKAFQMRPDSNTDVTWYVAMRPGKQPALHKENLTDALADKTEKTQVGVCAKVTHPFRVTKRQFGCVKVHYRSLKKSTAQLFTLSNRWMARGHLMEAQG